MAISRQQLAKELEPGLNALFGLEYKQYENQHTEMLKQKVQQSYTITHKKLLLQDTNTKLLH
jgi:hypothetical protein